MSSHDTLHILAQQILGCVCEALDATAEKDPTFPGCPCRSCVVAGAPSWENCCDTCPGQAAGGQLHVWTEGPYPADRFPDPSSEVRGAKGCPPVSGVAADFLVELARCWPAGDDMGNPPSCDELEIASRIANIDAWVMFQALVCCLPTTGRRGRGRRFLIRQPQVIGPEGGCVANRLRVTIDLQQPCLCPPESSP